MQQPNSIVPEPYKSEPYKGTGKFVAGLGGWTVGSWIATVASLPVIILGYAKDKKIALIENEFRFNGSFKDPYFLIPTIASIIGGLMGYSHYSRKAEEGAAQHNRDEHKLYASYQALTAAHQALASGHEALNVSQQTLTQQHALVTDLVNQQVDHDGEAGEVEPKPYRFTGTMASRSAATHHENILKEKAEAVETASAIH